MDLGSLAVAAVAVLAGAVAQRMIGMGWGLIVTPLVALAAGPLPAVLVVNLYGAASCVAILPRVWRDIDWRRLAWLAVPSLALTVPGLLLVQGLDTDVLRIAVGLIAIGGVVLTAVMTRTSRAVDGPGIRIATGSTIGLLNASVGMGAPVVGAYSLVSHWHDRTFVATMQPFWVLTSGATTLVHRLLTPQSAPDWPWWGWLGLLVPVLVGVVVGDRFAHRVDRRVVRWAVIVCSIAGGGALVIGGALALAA